MQGWKVFKREGEVGSDLHRLSVKVKLGTNLFSSSNPSGLETVVQHTKGVVSADMNAGLIEEFTRLEVETALKQMAPLKALGPDGMPPMFFQHYWDSIGDDVVLPTSIDQSLSGYWLRMYPIQNFLMTYLTKKKNWVLWNSLLWWKYSNITFW